MSAGEVVEVALRVAQPVGVVDAEPVDEALVEPAADLDVGLGEHLGVLDPDGGQAVDREEAPVVEVVVGLVPVDEAVVLLVVGRGAGRQREAEVVVPELAVRGPGSRASSSSPTTGISSRPSPAAHSMSNAAACSDSRPVLEHVPPPRVLGRASRRRRGWARCRRARPCRAARASADSVARPSAPPRDGVDVVERDHVVPVRAARARPRAAATGRPSRRRGRAGSGSRRGGLEQVEVLGDLQPVGAEAGTSARRSGALRALRRPTRRPSGRARPRARGARGAPPGCGAGS